MHGTAVLPVVGAPVDRDVLDVEDFLIPVRCGARHRSRQTGDVRERARSQRTTAKRDVDLTRCDDGNHACETACGDRSTGHARVV